MRKVILTFGLLAGAIISTFMIVGIVLWEKGATSLYFSEYIGYGTMVIALSMIFFGIKSYRDNYLQGAIGFWKGFQVGLLISLIASLMYAITWETYTQARPNLSNSLMEKYTANVINKMKEKSAPADKIDQQIKNMETMAKMYRNPMFRFGITIIEILPVGIIISLISAALLRKKEILPAERLEQNIPRLET